MNNEIAVCDLEEYLIVGDVILFEGISEEEIDISKLEIVSFLREGESYVSGQVMVNRAKELGADLGECHAKGLLKKQDQISEEQQKEWQRYYLVFPGTVWRHPLPHVYGGLYLPCLTSSDRQWFLFFRWLKNDWFNDSRLVRLRE